MECRSCGRGLFYLCKSASGEPQFVCTGCGQRYSAQIAGTSVNIRPDAGFHIPPEPEGSRHH
jgi:hypothetical protein